MNRSALLPYEGTIPPRMYGAALGDDGFSPLTPDQYIKIRLGDQLSYYQGKTVQLEGTLKVMQWSIYGLGGIGTLLAAVGFQLWIALTTTIVGVITVFLEYRQTENTLVQYNQTAADLANLKSWWAALSDQQQQDPANYDKLVEFTEAILHAEMAGWTQRMENALADLYENQTQTPPKNQPTQPGSIGTKNQNPPTPASTQAPTAQPIQPEKP